MILLLLFMVIPKSTDAMISYFEKETSIMNRTRRPNLEFISVTNLHDGIMIMVFLFKVVTVATCWYTTIFTASRLAWRNNEIQLKGMDTLAWEATLWYIFFSFGFWCTLRRKNLLLRVTFFFSLVKIIVQLLHYRYWLQT